MDIINKVEISDLNEYDIDFIVDSTDEIFEKLLAIKNKLLVRDIIVRVKIKNENLNTKVDICENGIIFSHSTKTPMAKTLFPSTYLYYKIS